MNKIYCAPGNGGTLDLGENIDIRVDDLDSLLAFALEKQIDLTVVGPELPLVKGITDLFEENGLRVFGVNKRSARLEGSKDFSKAFMERYSIPTARYKTYTDLQEAQKGLKDFSYPLVIKADGLCAGKGVIICQDENEAQKALKDILGSKLFGAEGDKIVIEEFLEGLEASLICFVTKDKIIPLESAKDYKKIFEGDKGPNTGGVGCYSPSPLFTEDLGKKIREEVLDRLIYGLNEEKMDFKGIIFIGLMIDKEDIKVLEFNTRFGDPETQVLIPRLDSDIVDLFEKTIDGSLEEKDFLWKKDKALTVILTSQGYPDKYEIGKEISGLEKINKNIVVFHNGSKKEGQKLLTNGGRVLSITGLGNTIDELRDLIYTSIKDINFDGMSFRKDIGDV